MLVFEGEGRVMEKGGMPPGVQTGTPSGGSSLGVDMDQTMRMFEAFNLYMGQRQSLQRKEALASKALHSIVDKVDQFDGCDITKYLRVYARKMELNRIEEREMVASFELVVVSEIHGRVKELRENGGETWEAFMQTLKEEFLWKIWRG